MKFQQCYKKHLGVFINTNVTENFRKHRAFFNNRKKKAQNVYRSKQITQHYKSPLILTK